MKMILRDPISVEEIKAKLAAAHVALTQKQLDFLKKHEGHSNIVIDGKRVFCRTCNVRDQ
jgi:hypothetical protein